MTPAAVRADAPPYHCTVCRSRWTYAEIRYAARCKRCGAGLTRTPADLSEAPRPSLTVEIRAAPSSFWERPPIRTG